MASYFVGDDVCVCLVVSAAFVRADHWPFAFPSVTAGRLRQRLGQHNNRMQISASASSTNVTNSPPSEALDHSAMHHRERSAVGPPDFLPAVNQASRAPPTEPVDTSPGSPRQAALALQIGVGRQHLTRVKISFADGASLMNSNPRLPAGVRRVNTYHPVVELLRS